MKVKLCFSVLIILAATAPATTIHFVMVNDCHAVMEPFGVRDPITLEAPTGGYARAITIFDSLKALYPDIIAVHAGDILTGGMLSPITLGRAVFDLWMSAGVQTFALGNHEFDYGSFALDSILGTIDVPLVSANLNATGFPNLERSVEPYRIVTHPRDGGGDDIRIALIGATTQEANLAGWITPLELTDPVEAIEDLGLPHDADFAIGLTHLDISEDRLVAALPHIDVVIGGHDHSTLFEPEWVEGTPIVMAGAYVRYVGHLTLEFVEGEGLRFVNWDVISVNSSLPEAPLARDLLDSYRDDITAHLGVDPYTTVAFTADSNILNRVVPGGVPGHEDTPLGNLVTDAYRRALGTDIAAEARGSLRMSIYSGPVTFADLFRAMPMGYDPATGMNARLIKMEFTGSALKQLLEYSFIGAALSAETFPQFSGLSMAYNPLGGFLNKIDTDRFFIGGEPWSATATYTLGGSELLVHGLDLLSYPYPAVDTSETTAYLALVAHCTAPDFVPTYSSEGRLFNTVTAIAEAWPRPLNIKISVSPNPFNSAVNIKVEAGDWDIESVQIFDIAGKLVEEIFGDIISKGDRNGDGRCGILEFIWRPRKAMPSGVYLARPKLIGNKRLPAKRLVYLK
ncbi:MAG TPA: hypothetical protein ENN07_08795 [candidate division Zixibacteria bacterium]|nr:hypothetical protein [candidate division Zixibacteria bacterium]